MRITAGSSSRAVSGRREFERAAPLIEELGSRSRGPGAVEVTLIGERRMALLNRGYKGRKGAAEILTFSYDDDPSPAAGGPAGEILICWKRLEASALALKVSKRSYLLRLVAHGLSHLEGHTHSGDAEAARMERRERSLLAGIIPERDLERMLG